MDKLGTGLLRCRARGGHLRQVLHRAAGTGLPLYITENAIALRTHLAAVAAALTEGVDVRGCLH
ncbi:hypothetical protein [Micromonospora sp. NPDC005087]|uniref:hypothetical protein n=1 Tax=Micromonospora sp. NPDC005087 TaxID=3364225 RepID=UPI0036B646B3